jgi:hypothetical protein
MELSQTTTSKFSGSFMIAEEFFWDGFGGEYYLQVTQQVIILEIFYFNDLSLFFGDLV